MSLTAQESPKWEARTKPRSGIREYTLEVSKETFWQLYVLVKGKNAADSDSPDRLTVSGQAETILREWLADQHPELKTYWARYEAAEIEAIDAIAAQTKPTT